MSKRKAGNDATTSRYSGKRFAPILLAETALVVALIMASRAPTRAGDIAQSSTERISLAQALAVASRANRALQSAQLEDRTAASNAAVARGALLPKLDAVENYSNTDNPVMVFSNLLAETAFTQSDFAITKLNHPAPLSNFQSQLAFSQPLYAGGRLLAGLQAAGDAALAQRWRTVRTRQQVEFAVIRAYYQAVLAEQALAVIKRALGAARAHRDEAGDLLAHGMVVKADLLRSEVWTGTLEQERIRADNHVRIADAELAHVLGSEDRALAPLENPKELDAVAAAKQRPLEEFTAQAIADRPELKIAQLQVRQAEEAVRIARAEYLPSVNLAAIYENDTERFSRAGNNYSVFVTGRLNLFNGLATRAKLDGARAELLRAQVLRDDLVHAVALEVRTAYYALETARRSLEVARRDNLYAAEALKILEDRYRSGLATNVAVLDAQTARQQADMRLTEARVAVVVDAAARDLAAGKSPAGRDAK